MMNRIIILLLFVSTISASRYHGLKFERSFEAQGKTLTYSTPDGTKLVESESTFALNYQEKKIYLDIGGGNGRMIFLPNATYAIFGSSASERCYIIKNVNGIPHTFMDEINNKASLRNLYTVQDSLNMKQRGEKVRPLTLKTEFDDFPIPVDRYDEYTGLSSGNKRCKFPYTALISLDFEFDCIRDISMVRKINVDGRNIVHYHRIKYNNFLHRAPYNGYFTIPSICYNPIDWCSTQGLI
ncbi:Hypothetical protein ORPV_871 [Orpheovirus IHUMI-LCC2]|uniref:Uncharacterized protein n=1 Tax=Orpheovirus IHUMI-LCC2 TaxID=2023057 RepID=A0A2I2L5E3_9VIRU|nr:Hypothetical protein ORPV_871 [Orpheovirus IHUMI-LCC2]SNW62775.1 Hypothetical protein ORPV_871 [Orpheovirus IHUMI-LCC2]